MPEITAKKEVTKREKKINAAVTCWVLKYSKRVGSIEPTCWGEIPSGTEKEGQGKILIHESGC